MNRPPADAFGQALMEDPPQWAELHVVANRREYPESLGLEVGPWEVVQPTADRPMAR